MKHIIWGNRNLDVDDWIDAYKEFLEINKIDGDPNDEDVLYNYMIETNDMYLDDEDYTNKYVIGVYEEEEE